MRSVLAVTCQLNCHLESNAASAVVEVILHRYVISSLPLMVYLNIYSYFV